jgi:hypothetical protein
VQTITVVDTVGPVLQGNLADITVDCHSIPDPANVSAYDLCTDVVELDMVETKTGDGCKDSYTLTRTWTATDGCGNTTTHVQTITVEPWKPGGLTSTAPGAGKALVNVAPNPFRDQSKISVVALESGNATIEVYDLQGRRIADLFQGTVSEGQTVEATFQPVENGAGAFIYRVVVNGSEQRGRVLYQP